MNPGEIVLEKASRSFRLVHERPRTLKELAVSFGRRRSTGVHALNEVDMRVEPGEAVGMVGRNGAGKTSTLRCLAGIVPLDSGRADCGGRVVSLLELGAGFGPDFTGRENIWLNGALHGFGREEIEERIERIIEFSELGEFIDVPVKAYSSGMFLRLGFAIVAHLDADVLLIDEILAVGDESFQRKCLKRISEHMERGATLVLVSHDPTAIERVCDRLVVLDRGRKEFDGPVAEGLLHYHRMLGTEAGVSQSLRPDGDRSLTIEALEIKDAEDRRRHMFQPGELLRVHLAVAGRAERGVLALEVRDQRGELVFRTDTAVGAVEDRLDASFEIPRLALLGGDYDLAAGVLDQDAPAGRLLDRVARFSVAAVADGEGVADLRGELDHVKPEDAVEQARAEAARKRAAGGYREDVEMGEELEDTITGPVSPEQLREWALIEVDTELLRSTRRAGAPVTGFKRLLLRLLRQYTNELEAQQTRFNVGVLARLHELEERIEELERGGRT